MRWAAMGIMASFILVSGVSFSWCQGISDLPALYGEVIYRYNENSPFRLFVVGIGHRDAVTRKNGSMTSKVQAEVYMISDWLIDREGVQLLLPEGFFSEGPVKPTQTGVAPSEAKTFCGESADLQALEAKLADESTFVNAEMLLQAQHPLGLRQVEDSSLYRAAQDCLLRLTQGARKIQEAYLLKSRLDYLQERRTAAILQRVPEVIQEEFLQGNIKSRKAVLTIGASHLPSLIRYLNEKRITIYAPLVTSDQNGDFVSDLNLIKEKFAVFVILPKTLAQDRKILEANQLGNIVDRARRQPFVTVLPDISPASN
jgi:hypothetical protein